mmetsp:Transcript_7955/g.14500  ORF Transcript_7955/g.14500 Transcript_7955/m.14500 type:complete len:93 (-) Transcript_7955:323-601(-)
MLVTKLRFYHRHRYSAKSNLNDATFSKLNKARFILALNAPRPTPHYLQCRIGHSFQLQVLFRQKRAQCFFPKRDPCEQRCIAAKLLIRPIPS